MLDANAVDDKFAAAHGYLVDRSYFYKKGSAFSGFQGITGDLRKQKFLSELYQEVLGEAYADAAARHGAEGGPTVFTNADVQAYCGIMLNHLPTVYDVFASYR